MPLDRIVTILGVIGGMSTIALWVSKARESDVVLSLTLQALTKDIDRLRGDLADLRSQQLASATHLGRRISITRSILWKTINYLNNTHKLGITFFDLKDLED